MAERDDERSRMRPDPGKPLEVPEPDNERPPGEPTPRRGPVPESVNETLE